MENKDYKKFILQNKSLLIGKSIRVTFTSGNIYNGVVAETEKSTMPSGISLKIKEENGSGASYHLIKEHLLNDFILGKSITLFNGDILKLGCAICIDTEFWDHVNKEQYQLYLAAKDAWRTKMN